MKGKDERTEVRGHKSRLASLSPPSFPRLRKRGKVLLKSHPT